MNEQLRQAMADAAGVGPDSPVTAIGDALLLPEETRNGPAPGYLIEHVPADETRRTLRLMHGHEFVFTSRRRSFLVRLSWHNFRQVDARKWVLA